MNAETYFRSMNPKERKDWRRAERAAGRKLALCRFCGFPTATKCPVCAPPAK